MTIDHQNRLLRFGLIQEEPASTACALSPDCDRRGYGVEAALAVCQFLNLTCTFEWYEQWDYGELLNESGNWTGMIQAVLENRFDTSAPVFNPTYDRQKVIDLSAPFFYMDVVLFTRALSSNEKTLDWQSIFRSFEWPVWFCFVVSFLILTLISVVRQKLKKKLQLITTDKAESDRVTDNEDISDKNANANDVSDKDADAKDKTDKEAHRKILIAYLKRCYELFLNSQMAVLSCCFLELMLASAYAGATFSRTLGAGTDVPFTDVESFISCVQNDKCALIAPSSSYSQIQWLLLQKNNAPDESGTLAEIAKSKIMISPLDRIAAEILGNRDTYLTMIAAADIFGSLTEHNRQCQFYAVLTPLTAACSFPFRKNWTYREKLDRMASRFLQSGLPSALEQKYRLKPNLCPSRGGKEKDADPTLSLNELFSIFIIYVVGLISSCLAFLVERFKT